MGTIRTRSDNGKLFLDFRVEGKRCREQTDLDDTALNRKRLGKVLQRLDAEIAAGTFDYASFFPGSKKNSRAQGAERVNDFASPCFMNLLLKPGCSSRRFSPLRVG